jgi:Holliday junction resolvase RusA-like endonuclease
MDYSGIMGKYAESKGFTMQIEFIIEGKVKPKQSFRYTRFGHKYTPRDVKQYARDIQYSFYAKYSKWLSSMFFEKPLRAEIEVYIKMPQSFSKIKKQRAIAGEIRPLIKPDVDNCTKNIFDALNGIVYPDDKQIVELSVKKFYSETEFVKVRIMEV